MKAIRDQMTSVGTSVREISREHRRSIVIGNDMDQENEVEARD